MTGTQTQTFVKGRTLNNTSQWLTPGILDLSILPNLWVNHIAPGGLILGDFYFMALFPRSIRNLSPISDSS